MSKISFYDSHGKLSYNPNTEKNVGVGGAEKTLINVSRELVKRGHEVTVYVNCNFPNFYDGVKYIKYQDYKPNNEDVLVGFENFPTEQNAKMLVNWSNRFTVDDVLKYKNVDRIIVVSPWHRDYYASVLGNGNQELVNKLRLVNLGVSENFYNDKTEKQEFNITYAGSPAKGGMVPLIGIYERLKEEYPQVKIHVYGGGALWGWDDEQYRQVYDRLLKSGVLYHGQIGSLDMAKRLNQAEIFLYPVGSHHKETFCLVALEAMASGCIVIGNESGNLKNLVKDNGYIIDGDINNYLWQMDVAEKIKSLYKDRKLLNYMGRKSREYAKKFTWEQTAIDFENALL